MRDNQVISDDQKVIELLRLLCEAYPQAADKHRLIKKLWPEQVVSDWSLSRLISDTRQILGDTGKAQGLIQTIRGKGFRLNEVVTGSESIDTSPSTTQPASDPQPSQQPVTTSKRLFIGLGIVALLALGIGVSLIPGNPPPQKDLTTQKVQENIRVAVLPVYLEGTQAIDDWVKIGVMSLASEQLDKYSSISSIPVATVIGQLGNLMTETTPPPLDNTFYQETCEKLGCTHVIAIQYRLENKKPILGYQVLSSSGISKISEFMEADVIDTADMMLDHLASDLLPNETTRLSLQDTYSANKKANRDYAIGVHELFSGDLKSAKQYLEIAIEKVPDFFWAKAYLAEVDYRGGQLEAALNQINELKRPNLEPTRAYFLEHLLSNVLYSQGKLSESMDVTRQLIDSGIVNDNPLGLAKELMNMGTSLQAIGKLDEAESYLIKSLQNYQKAQFGEGEGKAIFNLANVYLTKDQKDKAIDYYQQAREIFKKYQMNGYALMAKHQIATTSLSSGRYQYAENELRLLLDEYRKIGDEEGELIAYYDLAVVSLEKQDFVEGANRIELLLKRLEQTSYDYLKQQSYRTAVKIALMLGDNEKAKALFAKVDGEWVDSRAAYALIPAHLILNRGEFKQALDKANEIKQKLANNWTDAHEEVLIQIEEAVKQNKIIPLNY
ncbi:tetratricopeptide repeat protein [Aliikangiella marina]|nr:tetratricopeptide repeat protein [Aliikangiella marina]